MHSIVAFLLSGAAIILQLHLPFNVTGIRQLTGDKTFDELEQANFDWLFGCNPWGTSMVYGLPSWGDTPVDPHSAFTHLKNYPNRWRVG